MQDVVFSDFGRGWEVLRRVTHAAARKYAVTEALSRLVVDAVDETLETIRKREGNNAFDPEDYIYVMNYSIIAGAAYGDKYVMQTA